MNKIKYITKLSQVPQIPAKQLERLERVSKKFAFRSNEYYQSLINWLDEDDPIRRIVIPDERELEGWGRLDASNESNYTVVPGAEHKYPDTLLLLVNDVCGAYCRFCFRKRLFMNHNNEIVRDVSQALEYVHGHPEINNILVTGGDPLVMSTARLEKIIKDIAEIEHIGIIRIGTRIPAVNPYRILNDESLLDMVHKYSLPKRRIYIMVHFIHPRELTPVAIDSLSQLLAAGAIVANQTPLIRGVNDDPGVLAELFEKLSFVGVPQYYVFQCRPTLGNKPYALPIVESYEIFEKSKKQFSGLAKRARLVMSHATGKIEIVGVTENHIYLRYHRTPDPKNESRFMIFRRDPTAYWFDDLTEMVEEYVFEDSHEAGFGELDSKKRLKGIA